MIQGGAVTKLFNIDKVLSALQFISNATSTAIVAALTSHLHHFAGRRHASIAHMFIQHVTTIATTDPDRLTLIENGDEVMSPPERAIAGIVVSERPGVHQSYRHYRKTGNPEFTSGGRM